jgi:hypothetical protein
MRTGKNLVELAAEIERRAGLKRDYIAPVGKMQMAVVPDKGPALAMQGKELAPINALAHGQIAEYAGIPKAYYDRMVATQPHLLAANVNTWLNDKASDKRMVRTMENSVRAFLSDKYRPLENEDLGEAVLPALLKLDLEIMSTEITERRMYIKAVDRRLFRDVPTGRKMGDGSHVFFDTVCPAIIISNSEVGCGRLLVETGVYTKVCTNMAMIGAGFKKTHLGARSEISDDVYEYLSDATKKITDAAVWAQITDVIKGAFDAAKFEAVIGKLTNATEDKIEGDVVELVNKFSKRNTLTEGVRDSVLRQLIEGGDLTRYGLHAAVTRASADVEDYDLATDLERLGGSLIELPRQEWKQLLAA